MIVQEPCGCIRTETQGHSHTKLCIDHRRELFSSRDRVKTYTLVDEREPTANEDLI
jgi:hypothetical protein